MACTFWIHHIAEKNEKKARKYIRTIFFLLSWVLMYSMNHVILSVLLAFYGELRAMGRQGASGAT